MGYYSSMILLVPAIILTFYAQFKVNAAYRRYSGIANSKGITGRQAAEIILSKNGMQSMPINHVSGNLTDNYNPRTKSLNLSAGVYNSPSIAAIGIAAHECGHAIQDNTGYGLLKFRNTIVPLVNLCSNLSWPILIIGLILGYANATKLGILLFCGVILFHLVTLPVELDASRRAIKLLQEYGIVTNDSDISGAKSVLNAAALTYVAALASAVANLLRMIAISKSSRR